MKNGRQNIAMDFFMDDFAFSTFRKVTKNGVETLESMDVKTLAVRWDGELHLTEQKRAECPMGQRAVPSEVWRDKCVADKICASAEVFRKQRAQLKDSHMASGGAAYRRHADWQGRIGRIVSTAVTGSRWTSA